MTFLSGFAEGYINERNRVQDRKNKLDDEQRALNLRAQERAEDFKMRRDERNEDRVYQQQKERDARAERALERAADRQYDIEDSARKAAAAEKKDKADRAWKNLDANTEANRRAMERAEDRQQQLKDDARKGFMDEQKEQRKRRADREDLDFTTRLKILSEQRDRRNEKAAKERELASQARSLADFAGDPAMAPDFLQELSNKVDYSTIQERIGKGLYVKNPNHKAPEQTLRVPDAVRTERYDEGLSENPEINARLDAIDPSLRQGAAEETTVLSADKGGYIQFKPEVKETKIGTFEQAQYDLDVARRNKDPQAIADAELKVTAHQNVLTQRAIANAKAQGKSVRPYVMLDENGQIVSRFAGEMRPNADGEMNLFNVSNPQVDANGNTNPRPVQGNVIEFNDDDAKALFDLQNRYGKQAADYNTASDKYVGALSTIQTINQILERNPSVTTAVSNVAVLGQNIQDEIAGINDMSAKIDGKISSNDISGLGKDIAEYEENLGEMTDKYMSQGITDLALDKALYEGQRKLLAYQMAAANGITGAGLNKKDYDNFYEATGGKKNKEAVQEAMRQTAYGVFNTVDSARDTLDNNQEVKTFENYVGVKTGLRATRLGDKLARTGNEHLQPILNDIVNANKQGRNTAVQTATGQPAVQEPLPLPQLKNDEASRKAFEMMESGTEFIDPQGNKRRKP